VNAGDEAPDPALMDLVRFALAHHVERTATSRLLVPHDQGATVVERWAEDHARWAGDFHVMVETDGGERIGFDRHAESEQLHGDLEPGQRVQVSVSELTGRAVAVDTVDHHHDLVGGRGAHWDAGVGVVLVLVAATYLCLVARRTRRWAVSAAAVALVLEVLRLLGG
jgi:hypothetical protein